MEARLTSFLAAERVLTGLEAVDKWSVIDALLETVSSAEGVPADLARPAVLARERQISTGLEQGIALPHGMLVRSHPSGVTGIEAVNQSVKETSSATCPLLK